MHIYSSACSWELGEHAQRAKPYTLGKPEPIDLGRVSIWVEQFAFTVADAHIAFSRCFYPKSDYVEEVLCSLYQIQIFSLTQWIRVQKYLPAKNVLLEGSYSNKTKHNSSFNILIK